MRGAASVFLFLFGACRIAPEPGPPPDAPPALVVDAGTTDTGAATGRDAQTDSVDAATKPDAGDAIDAGGGGRLGFDADRWRRSVIYFLMTDRFADGDPSNNGDPECHDPSSGNRYHGGDFAGLVGHLDYLEALGANTLWITPVNRQIARRNTSCGYHGYWADLVDPDDGAIEPRLGRPEELEGLIAALHARDMALMVDLVVNHSGHTAPIVTAHPDWFHQPEGCEARGVPEVECPLSSLPDFAQEKPEVADYLDALSAGWARRFAFDAVRMDTVKHVPVSYFADRWIPTMLDVRPELYLLGEIFDEGSYDLQLRYRAAGFHGFFDFPLRRAMLDSVAAGASLSPVARRVQEAVDRFGIDSALLRSTFLDNHDVPRFASEITERGGPAARAERHRLALSLLFTIPGIPAIYAGDELGDASADNRRDMPSWAFAPSERALDHEGYLEGPGRSFEHTRQLITLRRSTPALHFGHYNELWRPNADANLYAFYRRHGASRVVVVANGEDTAITGHVLPIDRNGGLDAGDRAALLDPTRWTERLGTPATLEARAGGLAASVPARSVAVWTFTP